MFNISNNRISLLVLVCVTIFYSCNQSSLSTVSVTDLSLLGANIEIQQDPYDKAKNSLYVSLFDNSGNRVSNDSIILIFNDIETKVNHKQGLYYTDESYYSLADVPVSKDYKLEIKLSDGKKYLIGKVIALPEENIGNVVCDENGDLSKDAIVQWRNLKSLDELSISTSVKLNSSEENVTNYDYRPELVQKIYSSGNYVFSKYDYRDGKSVTTNIELNFRTTKSGEINPNLIKGSKINISANIEKVINFKDKND